MLQLRGARSAGLEFPVELDEADCRILRHVIDNRLSMVSPQRLFATLISCRYACEAGIAGAFVECGVWRGGNAMIAADVFARHGKNEPVLLFDTFSGMTAPCARDVDLRRRIPAQLRFQREQNASSSRWASAWKRLSQPRWRGFAGLDEVRRNFEEADIASGNVGFIAGDVLETLSVEENLPQKISVLRLDTDWYQSTKKELEVLWPRVSPGGILMVDDYGHWAGAKEAVDEYFGSRRPLLHYIDHTGRMAIKA